MSFTVTQTPPCDAQPPLFTVVAIYDPSQTDLIQIRVISSESLATTVLTQVLVTPQSQNPVADVTGSFVYQGNNTWLGSYTRNMGYGDIASIQVQGSDSCGNLGVSSGAFSREFKSSTDPVVITNSSFSPALGERTGIYIQVLATTQIKVSVYDRGGKLIRVLSDSIVTGTLETFWDGLDASGVSLPSGIYVVAIEMDGKTETRKVALKK